MQRTRPFSFVLAVALAVLGSAFASCGSDDDSSGTDAPGQHGGMMGPNQPDGSIRVDLVNWAVEPAQTSAKAGTVTFWAVHAMDHAHGAGEGGAVHDLQVMRLVDGGRLELVGQVQGLGMGEAKALTLELSAGQYELVCNVVETVGTRTVSHYTNGMHTSFTVTG